MEEKTDSPTTLISAKPFDKIDEPNDGSRHLTGWRLALVTISLALGMFLTGVDASIIGVATPGITTSFQAIDDPAWYGSGYMLPHTALQPILGSFFKSFNVRYVCLVSIIIFEAGSILCAAAPTSTAFIFGRVIAGCGAAGILQGTLTIVGYSVPKKQVPLYYGYVLSVQGISACTSPKIYAHLERTLSVFYNQSLQSLAKSASPPAQLQLSLRHRTDRDCSALL